MKFQCLNDPCKKTFMYPAVITVPLPLLKDAFIEKHVCPYCYSLDFEEAVESVPKLDEQRIVSVKSVPLEEVDVAIKDGYEVKELYARSATMIKKEKQP